MQSIYHNWLLENGPWAWNTSFTRDKEPTCPEPGLSLWMGLSFLFHAQLMPFEARSLYAIWHLVNPTVISVFCREETGSFLLRHKKGVCRQIVLCQPLGETGCPWGTKAHYWSWPWSILFFGQVYCRKRDSVDAFLGQSNQLCHPRSSWGSDQHVYKLI